MISETNSKKKYSVLKNIFNKTFVISAIIPVIIFQICHQVSSDLSGLILSGIWCIAVVILDYIRTHKINALASISVSISAIGLVGTIFSRNPDFFLASDIVVDFLFGSVLFISLILSKPFIKVVAEESFLKNVPDRIKSNPKYEKNWIILTAAWGISNFLQAIIRIILLKSVSISTYYTISRIYSNICYPILIAASIIFSKWYLTKDR